MKSIIILLGSLCFTINLMAQDFNVVEQMPYFAGCDSYKNGGEEKRTCSNNGVISYVSENLVYPTTAKDKQTEGTVYISFVVNEDGSVSDGEIINDIGDGCGEAALAVLADMPTWEPAQKNGKAVAVKLNLPIHFSLKSAMDNNPADAYKLVWGQLRGSELTRDQIKTAIADEISVRDEMGNTLPISALTFSYEKRRYYIEAQSKGDINEKQRKIIKKSKPGGVLIVSATIQKSGNFVDVDRVFDVVK